MKLNTRFLQLPVQFDAQILAREIASLEDSAWRPHPAGYAGNDYVPLIAAYGDPGNEGFSGPMLPTPHLSAQRPYLWESLASLGAVLGRTRLMRLSGHAEVSEHADVNYYWRDRMRVHVPIVTQPVVSFHCADIKVHMAVGECWVFDTWSLHRVINDQTQSRIHLVADTVGGEGMLRLLAGGRAPNASAPQDWIVRKIEPTGEQPALQFETTNVPKVMSPWEIREHLNFLLSEAGPNQPAAKEVVRIAGSFLHKWRALWAAYGEAEAGWPRYRALVAQFASELKVARADRLLLVNEVDFFESLSAMVLAFAVVAERAATLPVHTQGAP